MGLFILKQHSIIQTLLFQMNLVMLLHGQLLEKQDLKGSRKNTAYAATVASEKVASEVVSMGMTTVAVKVKGPGAGRESAIRALSTAGLQVTSISDVTPLPHNGCRPKKQRRV
jgi:small subunit ribosomal protein S11